MVKNENKFGKWKEGGKMKKIFLLNHEKCSVEFKTLFYSVIKEECTQSDLTRGDESYYS
jgi:hypothetical protein